MNRKDFLKRLGLGAVGAVVGAKVITEIAKEKPIKYEYTEEDKQSLLSSIDSYDYKEQYSPGLISQMQSKNVVVYSDRTGIEAFHKAMRKLNDSYGS